MLSSHSFRRISAIVALFSITTFISGTSGVTFDLLPNSPKCLGYTFPRDSVVEGQFDIEPEFSALMLETKVLINDSVAWNSTDHYDSGSFAFVTVQKAKYLVCFKDRIVDPRHRLPNARKLNLTITFEHTSEPLVADSSPLSQALSAILKETQQMMTELDHTYDDSDFRDSFELVAYRFDFLAALIVSVGGFLAIIQVLQTIKLLKRKKVL